MKGLLMFLFWQTGTLVNILTCLAVVAIIVFFAFVFRRIKKENSSEQDKGEK